MKSVSRNSRLFVGASLALGCAAALAQIDSCELGGIDPYSGCDKVLSAGAGNAEARRRCEDGAAYQRTELQGWGIDVGGVPDSAIFDRYNVATVDRCKADREQSRLDSLEADRLAAERTASEAKRAQIDADRDKALQDEGARQLAAGQQLMQEQNEMLKGLGVNLGGLSMGEDDEDFDDDTADIGDDDYSPTELRMYQQMVDSGAAPGCKGLKGVALVECVDDALDAEE